MGGRTCAEEASPPFPLPLSLRFHIGSPAQPPSTRRRFRPDADRGTLGGPQAAQRRLKNHATPKYSSTTPITLVKGSDRSESMAPADEEAWTHRWNLDDRSAPDMVRASFKQISVAKEHSRVIQRKAFLEELSVIEKV